MPEPDLNFVLRRLDAIQKELREIRLRDEQREASHQTLLQTLTRQMVSVATEVEERLNALETEMTIRFDRIDASLSPRS